jgi:hypothetical protein
MPLLIIAMSTTTLADKHAHTLSIIGLQPPIHRNPCDAPSESVYQHKLRVY